MSIIPRVVLGNQLNGQEGLRCTLEEFNALTGDSNGPGFSFDSAWTGLVKPILTGIATVDTSGNATIVSHGAGFVPFMECRRISGTTIFDDLMNLPTADTVAASLNSFSGVPVIVDSATFAVQPQAFQRLVPGVSPEIFQSYSVIYVVFNVPVPNPS